MNDHLDKAAAKLDAWAAEEAGRASVLPAERDTTIPGVPDLAKEPAIIEHFREAVGYRGVVGEEDIAILLYLALTSRLLDKPVSIAVKGPSSSGKSWTVEQTIEFFPPEAFLTFTAVSEKAFIHSKEPFSHRTLVFYEVTGLREIAVDNQTAYFVRTLLSEGRLEYEHVIGTPNAGFETTRIVKEGPTNIIFTTTKTRVHPENETRCLSLNTDDSPEQTRAVILQLAREKQTAVDLRPWHRLQAWLASAEAEKRTVIPYAQALGYLVPPVAIRLRRDFSAVLTLIRAHAVLHQLSRDRDEQGRIIATLNDYKVIRDLVVDAVSEGVEATVSPTVRETVEAIRSLGGVVVGHESPDDGVTAVELANRLGLEKMGGSRRLRRAREAGYVKNLETRRFRPGRWVVAEPMPEGVSLLPDADALARYLETQVSTGDSEEGIAVSRAIGDTDTTGSREKGEL